MDPLDTMPGLCPHFGDCGGCATQDVPYPEQLKRKAAMLGELFRDAWAQPIQVEPAPIIWHYRNKVELKFDRKQYEEAPPPDFPRETVLGFRREGCWYWTLDLEECRIFSAALPALLEAVRAWFRREGLPYHDSRRSEGLLRYLVVRESKSRDQRLVILIAASDQLDPAKFADAVAAADPGANVLWGVSAGRSDVATASDLRLLSGEPWLHETLDVPDPDGDRALDFRISPFGFFQVNPWATERLYGIIRAWVKESRPATLYDLYGGSGGIALSCADLAGEVVSVENFAGASEDGVFNAAMNKVGNVRFVTLETARWLGERKVKRDLDLEATVIVDPPRSGLQPKAVRRLVELRPREVIYVSCKPTVLAQELPALLEGYDLRQLQAIDLFPHTPHVEVLARLVRK